MHPRMLAQRQLVAVRGIHDASVRLAQKLGLADAALDLERITHREPGVRNMLQLEAVAAFLGDLESRFHPEGDADAAILERLRAVGVSESWVQAIEKKLAGEQE